MTICISPKMISLYVFALMALLSVTSRVVQGKYIFCYYSSFAQSRQGIGRFMPEDINPYLCTHIIYAFVDITPDGRDLMPFNRNDQGVNGLYARTMALKEKNPALKILLAVGGWQIGSKPFLPMISSEDNRKIWVKNVVSYLREHKFDGFDVDWEFPATRGSPPEDKYRFTLLMKDLYESFIQESAETGREKLMLTLATAAGTYYIDTSYEPYKIIQYIDYMLLMAYNYHGQWEKITGHHSGLYRHRDDPTTGEKSQLYQQWSIDYWLNIGMPKSRMIIGIPTYGMSFTLADESDNGVHAAVTGGGRLGDSTKERGILSYYEICTNLRDKGWHSEWVEDQAVPYAYGGDQWVGYDNQQSIALKVENILSRDLAGAFVWSVEMDDYKGTCEQGEYPLLSTIQKLLEAALEHGTSASQELNNRTENVGDISHNFKTLEVPKTAILEIYDKAVSKGFQKMKVLEKWTETPVDSTEDVRTSAPDKQMTTKDHKGRMLETWWKDSVSRKANVWRPWSKQVTDLRKKSPEDGRNLWVGRNSLEEADDASSLMSRLSKKKQALNSWLNSFEKVETDSTSHSSSSDTSLENKMAPKPTVVDVLLESDDIPINAAAAAASDGNICSKLGVGTFADPMSCDHFIVCVPGHWREYALHNMTCPFGTRFDADLKICNYASHVDCKL